MASYAFPILGPVLADKHIVFAGNLVKFEIRELIPRSFGLAGRFLPVTLFFIPVHYIPLLQYSARIDSFNSYSLFVKATNNGAFVRRPNHLAITLAKRGP